MKKLFAIFLLFTSGFVLADEAAFQFKPDCYVHFSPKGGATAAIVNRINLAEKEVVVQAYNFTSAEIADALIGAHNRGVKVTLMTDGKQPTANGNKLQYSKDHGVPVFLDKKHAIAHDKVMVIDNRWVHTGSFNFSANAENRNAENSMWCYDQGMAKIYNSNFKRHLDHAVQF